MVGGDLRDLALRPGSLDLILALDVWVLFEGFRVLLAGRGVAPLPESSAGG